MKFVIDLDTLALTAAVRTAKRGDAASFEVAFHRGGIAEDLPDDTVITFAAKALNDYTGDPVVSHNTFTRSEIGTDALYSGNPSFNTEELNALFVAAEGAAQIDYVDLIAEFTWSTDGGLPTSCKTFFLRVDRDVFQGTEGTPLGMPTPDEWLAARLGPLALSAVPSGSSAATATIDPTGSDNSVLYTADTAGTAGNSISVAYATPVAQATTTVAVTASAITVTPGTKARMVVSGASTAGVNGTLFYAGLRFGYSCWTHDGLAPLSDGVALYSEDGVLWLIEKTVSGGVTYVCDATGAGFPDGLTYSTPSIGTGTPTVTAGISSAAQVIAAVNASTPAAALVTATASGTVTGAVAAVAATTLEGGFDAALGMLAIVTHSDATFTEWGCVDVSPITWLPRTAGIVYNRTTSEWERTFIASGTIQTEILPNQ